MVVKISKRDEVKHLFIVGAGFSWHAGLPLTSEFTKFLLDVEHLKEEGPSQLQVQLVRKFVQDTFHSSDERHWPHLEDIFTCIDLSANTGHHLGGTFSPSYLRTVRRALIVRIIRMLRQRYTRRREAPDDNWKALESFFSLLDPEHTAFLSMNWDTVIEEGVKRKLGVSSYDYGCDALPAKFVDGNSQIQIQEQADDEKMVILKPHGSANWLYCDACRGLYWFSPAKNEHIADQLFRDTDWTILEALTEAKYERSRPRLPGTCRICGAEALATRFATFSYRKALDFPMYESSWRIAEELLRKAETWTFIGYSLPAADYEFKYLLKRVELSREHPVKIMLVLGGDEKKAEETRENYRKFFGPRLKRGAKAVFLDGLEEALDGLQAAGVLTKEED